MSQTLLTEITEIGNTETGVSVNVYVSWRGHQVIEIRSAWTSISLILDDAKLALPLIKKAIEFWENDGC